MVVHDLDECVTILRHQRFCQTGQTVDQDIDQIDIFRPIAESCSRTFASPGWSGDKLPTRRVGRIGKAETQIDQVAQGHPKRPCAFGWWFRIIGAQGSVGTNDHLRDSKVHFEPTGMRMSANDHMGSGSDRYTCEQGFFQQVDDLCNDQPQLGVAVIEGGGVDVAGIE